MAKVRVDDGYEEFSAGDAMLLPDAQVVWTVGDTACIFIKHSREDYYDA